MRIKKNKFSIILITIALNSCKYQDKKIEPVWSELPKVISLDSLKNTNFVATLENPISENMNIIYAPAFLYAWDKVKEKLKSPILLNDSNTNDFKLLNQSISYQDALLNDEFTASAEIINGEIEAKAFFNKTLPFEIELQVLDDSLLFEDINVASFGMRHYDEAITKFCKILYYKDNDNFILRLAPKDKKHEIILVKGLKQMNNLAAALREINKLISLGIQEKIEAKQSWKYEIKEGDVFAIPTISFNIETYYQELQGQSFVTSDSKKHIITTAYQRTAFVFNEKGAVVESEAKVAADTSVSISHPKKMTLDKPFYVVIKRVDKINPYFVMKVANNELLMKK